jgi:cobalt/nickel transport system permease protein
VPAPAVLAGLLDFRRLDVLANGDTPLHRLDARAKVIVALAFVVGVMSFDRYTVAGLVPFFALPIAVVAAAGLPAAWLARRVATVIPIALLIALPNPFFDREPLLQLGGLALSGGWVSLVSIVLRAVLATAAAVVLVAVTGFPAICGALERLGMPQPLAVQLLFLYRYLTVLGEEAQRMTTARDLRGGGRALSIRLYGTLVGRLLLRTWDRAERIHLAMSARGFTGDFCSAQATPFGAAAFASVVGGCALVLLLRTLDVTHMLGRAALGILR